MPDGRLSGDMVTRPDGRLYRSRKVTANAVVDDDEILTAVVVLGTHDIARAKPLADDYAAWQLGRGHAAVDPVTGWWRDSFENGRRCYVDDPEHGRAGVWFRVIAESTRPALPALTEAGYVAPARFILTVLHRPDPASSPGEDPEGNPVEGWTVGGEPMLASGLWRPVDRRPDDRLCSWCFPGPGQPVTTDNVQEVLL